jgi:hypothetical protein
MNLYLNEEANAYQYLVHASTWLEDKEIYELL